MKLVTHFVFGVIEKAEALTSQQKNNRILMAGVTIEKKTAEVNLSKLLAVNETLQKGAADLSQG